LLKKTNFEIKKILLGEYKIKKLIIPELAKSEIQIYYDGSDGGCTGCYVIIQNIIKIVRRDKNGSRIT